MDKKIIAVLVVVVVAAVAAYVVLTQEEPGVKRKPAKHPFPALKVEKPNDPKKRRDWVSPLKQKIDKLEITRKGKTYVIKRIEKGKKPTDVGKWKITKPIDYPANDRHIRSLINRLERLEFWEVLTTNPADFKELQVTKETGTVLRVFAGDKLLADMIVGESITAKMAGRSQSYTAVRKAASNDVWKVIGSMSYVFDKPLSRWRENTIVKEKRDRLAALALVDPAGNHLTATRDPKEDDRQKKYKNWVLESAQPEIPELDQTEFGRVASAISRLTAKDFADEKKLAETGLDKPTRKIVAVYKELRLDTDSSKQKKGESKKDDGNEGDDKKGDGKKGDGKKGDGKKKDSNKTAEKKSDTAKKADAAPKTAAAEDTPPPGPLGPITQMKSKDGYKTYVVLIGKEDKKKKAYYVKLADKKQIFTVRSSALKYLLGDISSYRDKTVVAVEPEKLVAIEVQHEKGTTVLEKKQKKAKKTDQKAKDEDKKGKKDANKKPTMTWTAVKPKDLELDVGGVKRITRTLESRFRARAFAKETDPQKTGLNKPTGRVILRLADGSKITLLIGKEAKKRQRYLQVKGKPDIYLMGSYPLNQLYKPPEKWKKRKRPAGGRRRRRMPPGMMRRRRRM
jgi:hypothetical protein